MNRTKNKTIKIVGKDTEEITQVSIALALKRTFTISRELPKVKVNTIVADFREAFDFYQDKQYWKNPLTHTFAFFETAKAEKLASAIIFYHGTLPEISICYHTKTIVVSSKGYSC